jgi:hypothetical protein
MINVGKMSALLITNIGNRNLLYKGKNITEYLKANPSLTFRSFTQSLWEKIQVEGQDEDLAMNILPPLLEQFSEAGGQEVVLYATDQNDGGHNQDTIFSARIIEALIQNQYPHFQVFIRVIKCDLVKESEVLCSYYQSNIREALTKDSHRVFWICDAGGTPQQQFALRLVAELMIPLSQRKMKYVALVNNESTILDRDTSDFSTVILAEQSRTLIENGKYLAALQLYRKLGENKLIQTLLDIAHARLTFQDKKFSCKAGVLDEVPDWQSWINKEPLPVPDTFQSCLSPIAWRRLTEILSVAQYYLIVGEFTQFLFHAYLFHEVMTLSVISKLWGFSDKVNFEVELRKFEFHLARFTEVDEIRDFLHAANLDKLLPGTISFLLVLPHEPGLKDSVVKDIILDFRSLNDKFNSNIRPEVGEGWRVLRNRYAHDGLQLSQTDLEKACPSLIPMFNNWTQWFGLPQENIFLQFNKLLLRRIGMAVQFA